MTRILILGKNGQLGWELQRTCACLGEMIALDYPELDLANPASLREAIQRIKPGILINAAAYTNVDKAENEPELARKVNALAPGLLAEEAKRNNAAFIHYSTDYVFDGVKGNPYIEDDPPNPINIYGASKLEGETNVQAVGGAFLIFRTSWVYSLRAGGFVTKVLQWARQQSSLRIVDDQVGSPTWARMLAEATAQVIAQGQDKPVEYITAKSGLYHLAGAGSASRYEWARAILEHDPGKKEQIVKEFLPAKTSEFPTAASRPLFTALENTHFNDVFNISLPPWTRALTLAMSAEGFITV
jgi:dTDP-4-dehydrorhamnose reductase